MSATLPSIGDTMSTDDAVAMQRPHLLALADPLAALRQRDSQTLPVSFEAKSSMPMRTRLGLSLSAQVWPGW